MIVDILVVLLAIFAVALGITYERMRALERRSAIAQRRFDLLHQLAPALTPGTTESTSATCARIVERLSTLLPSNVALCFYADDGRFVLGARRGDGYAQFLREGSAYEGVSIIDAARERQVAVAIGPSRVEIPDDVDVVDEGKRAGTALGPAAGSRDRVWALAVPLLRSRGAARRADVVGAIYLERERQRPFSGDDLRTALTVARLAADALERARFADAIRRDAQVDGLTSLMTPIEFRKRLRDEVAARRDLGLFFIDTDRFKLYNDTYGHAAGDKLLRALAATFEDIATKSGGFAGRNGGDEFCIALSDRTKDAAVEIAERVRASVDRARLGEPVAITVSIGVAHYPVDVVPGDASPADRLLEIADGLMYEAKRSGRNRVEFLRLGAQPRTTPYPGEGPIPRL